MAGLVPAIHVCFVTTKDVDGRTIGEPTGPREVARPDDRLRDVVVRTAMCGHDAHQISVSYKSRHSGFIPWISRTFQARGQCLIVFSR